MPKQLAEDAYHKVSFTGVFAAITPPGIYGAYPQDIASLLGNTGSLNFYLLHPIALMHNGKADFRTML